MVRCHLNGKAKDPHRRVKTFTLIWTNKGTAGARSKCQASMWLAEHEKAFVLSVPELPSDESSFSTIRAGLFLDSTA